MRGELWAMMLDSKRTFDALIERLAPDAATRDEILANRIYQQLSSAVAGSQEFTAIAKLYELDQEGDYDLIVLDTPPSRNALDFLDAPGRLTGVLPGPRDPHVPAPGGARRPAARARDGRRCSRVLQRVTGVDLLQDLSVFFRSLSGVIDGFTERARRVGALLADPAHDVPDRHLAAPRPGRGGDLLPPQAARGAGCRSAGSWSTACTTAPELDGALPGDAGRRRSATRSRRAWQTAAGGARGARRARRGRASRASRRRSATADVVIPELDDDVHDVEGLARIRATCSAPS